VIVTSRGTGALFTIAPGLQRAPGRASSPQRGARWGSCRTWSADAGVAASTRAGRLRLAFHLYNVAGDADRAAAALAAHALRD
jgi:selenocysteine lyase/cysteine desulfurase